MREVLYKKGMALAVICLFSGTSFLPRISGNIEQTESKDWGR